MEDAKATLIINIKNQNINFYGVPFPDDNILRTVLVLLIIIYLQTSILRKVEVRSNYSIKQKERLPSLPFLWDN
jgi:hypothetical protein